jgi:hypothetical protein
MPTLSRDPAARAPGAHVLSRYAHEADVVGDEPARVLIFTPGPMPVGMGGDRND